MKHAAQTNLVSWAESSLTDFLLVGSEIADSFKSLPAMNSICFASCMCENALLLTAILQFYQESENIAATVSISDWGDGLSAGINTAVSVLNHSTKVGQQNKMYQTKTSGTKKLTEQRERNKNPQEVTVVTVSVQSGQMQFLYTFNPNIHIKTTLHTGCWPLIFLYIFLTMNSFVKIEQL